MGEYIKIGERCFLFYVVDEVFQKFCIVRGKNFFVVILVENVFCDYGSMLSIICRYGCYNQLVYRKCLMLLFLYFLDLVIIINVM